LETLRAVDGHDAHPIGRRILDARRLDMRDEIRRPERRLRVPRASEIDDAEEPAKRRIIADRSELPCPIADRSAVAFGDEPSANVARDDEILGRHRLSLEPDDRSERARRDMET